MSAEELARRAVACKGWRWIPGMLPSGSTDGRFKTTNTQGWGGGRPDLDDPGTLGCFAFALLPDAWGPDADVTVHADGSCEVEVPGSDPAEIARLGCPYRVGHGFENVVDCLEAAP